VCMVCTGDIGEREHGVGTGVKSKMYKKKTSGLDSICSRLGRL
jgi:hypothetical protein